MGMAGSGGGMGGMAPKVENTATCQPPKLKLTRVANANSPMALTQAQGDARIFVTERAGLVRILRGTSFDSAPFADLRGSVLNQPKNGVHERGLLNFVLHPKFKENGRFHVFYTRRGQDNQSQGNEGDVVIAEGQQDGATDKAKTSLKVLTTVGVPDDFHIGGFLGFGRDGLLYAGVGDGGPSDSAGSSLGQDPKRRLAKILRIDVDNPSSKSPGNLDAAGADPLTWAYGVRNPFRGSFDSATGDLYFGDVGEKSWEEVNFVPAGARDINFGWGYDPRKEEGGHQLQSGMEGSHPFPFFTAKPWQPFGYLPVYEYPHDGNGWMAAGGSYMNMGYACFGDLMADCARAVIGGMVYRGKQMPDLYGRYIFGDHVKNNVMSFIVKEGKATCFADLTQDLVTQQTRLQGISAFGADANGELYVMDISAGNIYRIEKE